MVHGTRRGLPDRRRFFQALRALDVSPILMVNIWPGWSDADSGLSNCDACIVCVWSDAATGKFLTRDGRDL